MSTKRKQDVQPYKVLRDPRRDISERDERKRRKYNKNETYTEDYEEYTDDGWDDAYDDIWEVD